jgi:hypothetical protein
MVNGVRIVKKCKDMNTESDDSGVEGDVTYRIEQLEDAELCSSRIHHV